MSIPGDFILFLREQYFCSRLLTQSETLPERIRWKPDAFILSLDHPATGGRRIVQDSMQIQGGREEKNAEVRRLPVCVNGG